MGKMMCRRRVKPVFELAGQDDRVTRLLKGDGREGTCTQHFDSRVGGLGRDVGSPGGGVRDGRNATSLPAAHDPWHKPRSWVPPAADKQESLHERSSLFKPRVLLLRTRETED